MKRDTSIKVAGAALGVAALGGIIVYSAFNEGAHNVNYTGTVLSEHRIVGNVARGYGVPQKGLRGLAQRALDGVLRPGQGMHLYKLRVETKTYDTKSWGEVTHHRDKVSKVFYLQTEGDVADKGDQFSGSDFGRLSKVFRYRGIRVPNKDAFGRTGTKMLYNVHKNASLRFSPKGKSRR